MELPSGVRHVHTKVAGVSFENEDGTSRQTFIRKCQPLETLVLKHDKHNPHDPNAVQVCRVNGEQIGFLNSRVAGYVMEEHEQGYSHEAILKNITGGGRSKAILGVNILLIIADPGVSAGEMQEYVDQLDLSEADSPLSDADSPLQEQESPGGSGCLSVVIVVILGLIALGYFVSMLA